MKLYDCKVRLAGSLYNEVPKTGVTAAEIYLFRHIHGNDAVTEIYETGEKAMTVPEDRSEKPRVRTQSDERTRLIEMYGEGLRSQQINKTSPTQALAEIFGIAGRLPEVIEGAMKSKDKPKAAPVAEEPEPDETDLEAA